MPAIDFKKISRGAVQEWCIENTAIRQGSRCGKVSCFSSFLGDKWNSLSPPMTDYQETLKKSDQVEEKKTPSLCGRDIYRQPHDSHWQKALNMEVYRLRVETLNLRTSIQIPTNPYIGRALEDFKQFVRDAAAFCFEPVIDSSSLTDISVALLLLESVRGYLPPIVWMIQFSVATFYIPRK